MRIMQWMTAACLATGLTLAGPATATADIGPTHDRPIKMELLASGLLGSIGGAIGPDGALYVPQGATGEVTRVDVQTGQMSTFASGLPPFTVALPVGGPIDVAFVDGTGYVLVSLVGPETFGDLSTGRSGIYRINDDGSATLVADLGAFSAANPPVGDFDWFAAGGVQYAMAAVEDGFLVTDGHHNRVLHVGFDGATHTARQYGNVVPAGIDIGKGQVLLAQTGAISEIGNSGQYAEIGEVTSFALADPAQGGLVAPGISMAVDVQRGPGKSLYVLSQGTWDPALGPEAAGAPALPFTGQLLRIDDDGQATTLVEGINLPTSLHFQGGTAYVVTMTGEVWKLRGVSGAQRH